MIYPVSESAFRIVKKKRGTGNKDFPDLDHSRTADTAGEWKNDQ